MTSRAAWFFCGFMSCLIFLLAAYMLCEYFRLC
jgi:hypothetical protein